MEKKIKILLIIIISVFIVSCSRGGIEGKKIFFGTPASYAVRLTDEIEKAGGLPVSIPLIETIIPVSNPELDSVFDSINDFDFIAFSSRNAIEAFFMQADSSDLELIKKEGIRMCAIGKDSELLEDYGITNLIRTAEPSPRGIIGALGELDGIEKGSIAVIVPEVIGLPEPDVVPDFIRGLEDLGMRVKRVNAYHTGLAKNTGIEKYIHGLAQGDYDVIAFTSTAEIEAFLMVMDSLSISSEQVIACFGPYTAANARALGFDVDIVAEDFSSFTGFAEAIDDYFTGRQ